MYQDYESQDFYLTQADPKQQINPRLGFVRKVYGIISFQLLITTIFVILCQGPLRTFLYNPYSTTQGLPFALFITCAVITVICAIMISCCQSIARKVPTNYIVLTIFTLAESYIVGYFTVFFEPEDVILAAVLTLTMTFALTLYACTTKRDVTMCGAALWIGAWALLACSILFFAFTRGTVAYKPAVIGISVVSIVFYGFYLIYDTQLIMGGKRYQLGLDDYIIAAIAVYMDIVVLFIRILRIIGMAKRR